MNLFLNLSIVRRYLVFIRITIIVSNRQLYLSSSIFLLVFFPIPYSNQTCSIVLYTLLSELEKEREKTFTNRPTKPFRAPAFTVAF